MSSVIEKSNGYLYVNSFLKSKGSDYNFTVNLPQITCTQLSLVGLYMDVILPNFYKTTGKDYSQFGITVNGTTILLQCDVYIQSVSEFVLWFNSQSPRYKMEQQAQDSWQKTFSFKIRDSQAGNVYVNSSLSYDGWEKLGFTDYTNKATQSGSKIFDLSLSPSIQVRIINPNIKNNIFSNVGQTHFTCPLTSSFGSKMLYDLQLTEQQRNTIYFERPISIGNIEIQLLNCDFAPLYSCDFGSGRDQNNLEVILVLATRIPV